MGRPSGLRSARSVRTPSHVSSVLPKAETGVKPDCARSDAACGTRAFGQSQHAGREKWAYAKRAGSVTSPPQSPPTEPPVIDLAFHILVLLFLAAFLAGFIDSIAGGGGMITIPAMLLAGIPPLETLGTNKLQSLFGSGSATIA